jgi:hypothetical protein
MIGIIVTFLMAILGLCLLLVFCLRHDGIGGTHPTDNRPHVLVAGLSAALVPPFEIIVGTDDYRKLRTIPELKSVRDMFWRDRRRIVLMWLDELWKDVRILWEFRRFLVRNGLQVTFREEASIVFTGLLALVYLKVVRAAVFVFGPFALQGALGNARLLVGRLSTWAVVALARVPAARKAEIEQMWTQQLLAMGARTG